MQLTTAQLKTTWKAFREPQSTRISIEFNRTATQRTSLNGVLLSNCTHTHTHTYMKRALSLTSCHTRSWAYSVEYIGLISVYAFQSVLIQLSLTNEALRLQRVEYIGFEHCELEINSRI